MSALWTVIDPKGNLHTISSLHKWCDKNNLNYAHVRNSTNGFITKKHIKKSNDIAIKPEFIGHIKIIDTETNELLVNKMNAINAEAMSYALALSLGGRPNGNIMQMVFGNGASTVSAVGIITYLPPNVTGLDATLYNQTYAVFVDDLSPLDTDPTNDFIRINHTLGNTYSDVVVTALLGYNQPSGQQAFDNATDTTGTYIFDEIGLTTWDVVSSTGILLSHVIFHPVQKSLNRQIQIIYTIRIIMS